MQDNNALIKHTMDYVREQFKGESSGHDWWHIYRVWRSSIQIGTGEQADLFVVQLAALLHELDDYKLNEGCAADSPRKAKAWLEKVEINPEVTSHVCDIITTMSFKGSQVKTEMRTIEGMVVQDADRLDAVGAIGIARTFAYGGAKGREIYDPSICPHLHTSFEQYKNSTSPTINHFYEKLLLLKDSMNTESAKHIAAGRHKFMEDFLERFYREWEGLD